jgi:flagella basal body P-ring formation protein FlgA
MPLSSKLAFAAAIAVTAMSTPAQASTFADPAAIDAAVNQFTGAAPGMPGSAQPVDRRLRLTRCEGPLSLTWYGTARLTVAVQCPDPGSWRVFVPVLAAPRQEAAAIVVQRGEQVTVSVTGNGFSVSQSGEAMEPGAVGTWIRVRITDKGDPVRAQIIRPGLVVLPVEG